MKYAACSLSVGVVPPTPLMPFSAISQSSHSARSAFPHAYVIVAFPGAISIGLIPDLPATCVVLMQSNTHVPPHRNANRAE
jgi:hypothetical protein